MYRTFSRIQTAVTLIITAISILNLIMTLHYFGVGAAIDQVVTWYVTFVSILFDWIEPYLSKLGSLPFWWREGLVMLGMILGQWYQVIVSGHARLYEAAEFFASVVLTGLASYWIEASNSVPEAAFFGIAATFIQLIVRGSISYLHQTPDAEAWAGRYIIQSSFYGMVGMFLLVMANAGLG